MKKANKVALIGLGLLATVFIASSCTANFCNDREKARMIYAFEPGISEFWSEDNPDKPVDAVRVGEYHIYQSLDFEDGAPTKNDQLKNIINDAKNSGIYAPSVEFLAALDTNMCLKALQQNEIATETVFSQTEVDNLIRDNGYLKYYSDGDEWGELDNQVSKLTKPTTEDGLGYQCVSYDFIRYYKTTLDNKISGYRSCISTIGGQYGHYNGNTIQMDKTTWGDAWGKGGHIIEGLIVYPVAWLLDSFANIFSGNNIANFANGVPQILSLIVVTIIVRLFIFLVTIKSTLSQQKMTALQPELAKIQQKYPNANTNNAQKQRMAEEQMRLYKKHGVNPLSSLLVLIVQFPIFIGVWGAMQGSAALSTGNFKGLELSASIFDRLKMGPTADGWWVALILIILMSAGQFFSMKVPQWLQKARTKKVARLTKNPAEKSQNKTANIVSYVMLVMIIIMGFTLPAAMGVYWLIGAVVSLIQSLIMHFVSKPKNNK